MEKKIFSRPVNSSHHRNRPGAAGALAASPAIFLEPEHIPLPLQSTRHQAGPACASASSRHRHAGLSGFAHQLLSQFAGRRMRRRLRPLRRPPQHAPPKEILSARQFLPPAATK